MADENEDIILEFGAKIDKLIDAAATAKAEVMRVADASKEHARASGEAAGLITGHMSQIRFALQGLLNPLRGIRENLGEIGEAFLGAFAVHQILHFVENMAELGVQTERTMAILGVTAQETLQLSGIAKLTGTSMDGLSNSIEHMSLNVQKSTRDAFSPAAQGLKQLGINAVDFGKMGTTERFQALNAAVSQFNPSINLTNTLTAIGGRTMAQQLPLLLQNTHAWADYVKQIDLANGNLSKQVAGMSETDTIMGLFTLTLRSLGGEIFTKIKPAIDALIKTVTDYTQAIRDNIAQGGAFSMLLDGLVFVIKILVSAFLGLAAAIEIVVIESRAFWDHFSGKDAYDAAKAMEEMAARIKKSMTGLWDPPATHVGVHGGEGKKDAAALDPQGRDRLSAAMAASNERIKVIEREGANLKTLYEADAANFRITLDQKFAIEQSTALSTMRLAEGELRSQQAMHGLNLKQRQDLENKIKELHEKTNTELIKLDIQQVAAQRQIVSGYVGTVESSWNSSLRGMLAGTTSVTDALKKVFADLVIYIIEQLEKKLIFEQLTTAITDALHVKSAAVVAATEAAKTGAVTAGVATRTGAEEAGFLVSAANYVKDAMLSIGASLGKLFASLTAFFSFLGPAAPAAAAGVVAGVGVGAYAMISHYDVGSDFVPMTGLAMVHQGEKIIPADQQGPGYSGGGDVHLHVNALDGASVVGLFQRNSRVLAQLVMQALVDNPSIPRPRPT